MRQLFLANVVSTDAEREVQARLDDGWRVVQLGFVQGRGFWFLFEKEEA